MNEARTQQERLRQSWRVQTVSGGVCVPPISRSPSGTAWQCGSSYANTPHTAIALWCEQQHLGWVDIAAPGEQLRDEAVARERQRCVNLAVAASEVCHQKGKAVAAGIIGELAGMLADPNKEVRR